MKKQSSLLKSGLAGLNGNMAALRAARARLDEKARAKKVDIAVELARRDQAEQREHLERVAESVGADLSDPLGYKIVLDLVAEADEERRHRASRIAAEIGADLDNPEDVKIVLELAKVAA